VLAQGLCRRSVAGCRWVAMGVAGRRRRKKTWSVVLCVMNGWPKK